MRWGSGVRSVSDDNDYVVYLIGQAGMVFGVDVQSDMNPPTPN